MIRFAGQVAVQDLDSEAMDGTRWPLVSAQNVAIFTVLHV